MELTSDLLVDYAYGIDYNDFSPEIIHQTERLVLDSIGCCLGAYTSPPSKILRRLYSNRQTKENGGNSTVLCDGETVPVEYAALLNGLLVRYLDYNDCYISGTSVCHPSDHIPPLLAVAEAENRSGRELIEAIVLAYEIQCRGVDTGAIWHEGFDYVTWGLYSTAAAAGRLMGLDKSELESAIGIAATSSNGLLSSRLGDVSMWKGVAHPYASHNAVQACQMARAGLTGPSEVFKGEGGVFDAITGESIEIDGLGGRNGAEYRILRTNIKPFSCGYFMQSPISGVLELIQERDIDAGTISKIEIETFDQAVQVLASPEKWETENLNRETADHSIPYAIAAAVVYGDVSPQEFESEKLEDERVHRLMKLIDVNESSELTTYRNAHPGSIPSVVRIATEDASYEIRTEFPIGHSERPMSTEQLEAKARSQASDYLTSEEIEALFESCWDLSNTDNVAELPAKTLI